MALQDHRPADPLVFPRPVRFAACVTGWALSDIERWEAAQRGEPEPARRPAETERYLRPDQVAARYGVARQTIWRWARQDPRGERRVTAAA